MGIKNAVLKALGISEACSADVAQLNAAIARLDEKEIIAQATALKLSAAELASIDAVLPRIRNAQDHPGAIPGILLEHCLHMAATRAAEKAEVSRKIKDEEDRKRRYREGSLVDAVKSKRTMAAWQYSYQLDVFQKLQGASWVNQDQLERAKRDFLERFVSAG